MKKVLKQPPLRYVHTHIYMYIHICMHMHFFMCTHFVFDVIVKIEGCNEHRGTDRFHLRMWLNGVTMVTESNGQCISNGVLFQL